MDLQVELATRLLEEHPAEAARALETLAADDVASALAEAEPTAAGRVLRHMARHALPGILAAIGPEALAAIASRLDVDVVARLLRPLSEEARRDVYRQLPASTARSVRAMLGYPEQSAGALMDPEVLALPAEISVKDAIARIREHPQMVRYNVYVTDDEGRLAGVLNLREILLAVPGASLRAIMNPALHRIGASEDRHSIAQHPGWHTVHALPVVDGRGVYLGAIRYRTLRRIERELRGDAQDFGTTALALGDLFATGATGLVTALTALAGREKGDGDGA